MPSDEDEPVVVNPEGFLGVCRNFSVDVVPPRSDWSDGWSATWYATLEDEWKSENSSSSAGNTFCVFGGCCSVGCLKIELGGSDDNENADESGMDEDGVTPTGDSPCDEVGDVWNSAKSSSSSSTFDATSPDDKGCDLGGGASGAGSVGTVTSDEPFGVNVRDGGGRAKGDDVRDGAVTTGFLAGKALG